MHEETPPQPDAPTLDEALAEAIDAHQALADAMERYQRARSLVANSSGELQTPVVIQRSGHAYTINGPKRNIQVHCRACRQLP